MDAHHYAAEFAYPDKNVHGMLCTTVMKAFELTKGSMVFKKKVSGESRSFAKMSSLRRFNQAAYTIPELARMLRMFQLWALYLDQSLVAFSRTSLPLYKIFAIFGRGA